MLQLAATDGALTSTSTVTITVNAAALTNQPGTQWSMGFWTPFGQYSPIADIDWAALTHICQVGVVPNADGSLTDISQSGSTAPLIAAAHAAGKKVLLNIQPSSNMASAVTNHLATFISNIMAQVNANGYDGVDVDWENGQTQALIQAFIPSLRTALGSQKLLTADAQLFGFDIWLPVQAQLDRINVMTYDMGGGNWVDSWFNSPPFGTSPQFKAIGNIDKMRTTWVSKGWAADKINIGIPFYGMKSVGGSPVVTGPRQMFGATKPTFSEIRYKDLTAQYNLSGRTWDADSHTPWLAIPNGWISYDDVQSVTEKVQYARDQTMGGWIIWDLHSDYLPLQSPKHPLLNAVKLAR
jgi:chitinase